MGKRGNGEGTIYKRSDGLWCAAVSLDDGTRRVLYGKTRAAVNEKLARAVRDRDEGIPVARGRLTVAAYFGDWLTAIEPNVKRRTLATYRRYLTLHITAQLGAMPLTKLGPNDLTKLYAGRLAAGLSPRTVRHLHAVIHNALGQAARWQLITRNVADLVKAPRARKVEMQTFSHSEARAFLAAAAGNRLEALFVLALTTGMRQGELLGLHWADVHVDGTGPRGGPSLRVSYSLQRTRDGFVFEEPKTKGSRRTIILPDAAAAALRRHRAAQNAERLRLGAAWEDNDIVFANELGRPIEAGNLLRRAYWPLLAQAGVPRIRFHDLRHTFATLALGQGVNVKQVSEMLGHATIAITLDLYAHATETMQDQALAAMNALFGS